MKLIFIFFISYFIGSLPFAYIISKIYGKIDIRGRGSGNVGATNVLRVLGPFPGILVFFLDFFKGYAVIKISQSYFPEYIYLAGLAVIIGHCWTIFLKFKGGKGVATTLGVLLGIHESYLICALIIWFCVFLISRIVSLASLITALLLPLVVSIRNIEPEELVFIILYSAVIIYRHKSNIIRLYRGEEGKITLFSKKT